jgi:hypothetical protein
VSERVEYPSRLFTHFSPLLVWYGMMCCVVCRTSGVLFRRSQECCTRPEDPEQAGVSAGHQLSEGAVPLLLICDYDHARCVVMCSDV